MAVNDDGIIEFGSVMIVIFALVCLALVLISIPQPLETSHVFATATATQDGNYINITYLENHYYNVEITDGAHGTAYSINVPYYQPAPITNAHEIESTWDLAQLRVSIQDTTAGTNETWYIGGE